MKYITNYFFFLIVALGLATALVVAFFLILFIIVMAFMFVGALLGI